MIPLRIVSKIDIGPDCWEWNAARDRKGYGRVSVGRSMRLAHRVVYELTVGAIPDGLQLDHLCRNPPCVNPDHLEPVTNQENALRSPREERGKNMRRKTHCPVGHSYAGDNLYRSAGRRYCRACRRAASERYRAQRKGS